MDNVRLNQHFRSSSGPLQSMLTHNRGMTRSCGWLIISDTQTPTSTHSTRAWIIDTNAEEHMPHLQPHNTHTSKSVLVHEHTITDIYIHNHSTLCLSYLIHFHPNSAVFTLTLCLQNLLQATSIQP